MPQDLFSLDGRVALITGGNGGIGLGIARAFRDAGASVVVTGRNPGKNAAAAEELGKAHAVLELDVRDEAAVERTMERVVGRFGRLDVLVNNAGQFIGGPALEMARSDWDDVIATHLTGSLLCAKYAARAMVAGGEGGKIINIGSMYSVFGNPHRCRLRLSQDRRPRPYPLAGGRARAARHPGERDPARLDRYRHDRRPGRHTAWRAHSPPDPGRALGRNPRPCRRCGVPRLGWVGLRDRRGDPGRRRLLDLGSHRSRRIAGRPRPRSAALTSRPSRASGQRGRGGRRPRTAHRRRSRRASRRRRARSPPGSRP